MEVLDFINGEISDDGRQVALNVDTDKGSIRLLFNVATLEITLVEASGLLVEARKTRGDAGVHMVRVPTGVLVGPTLDRTRVVVGFETAGGLPHEFELPADSARDLAIRLRAAADRCKPAS